MRKFPKIKYPGDPDTDGLFGDEVVVLEKLDGANFRVTHDGDQFLIGTRNVEYQGLDDPNMPKAFRHAVEFVDEKFPDDLIRDLSGGITLYGEALHRHSLTYSNIEYVNPAQGSPYPKNVPNVVFFDARIDGDWFDWYDFESFAKSYDLPVTRVIEAGKKENLTLEVPEESMFGGQPEGIVVRRVDGLVRAKKVTDDFKEKNAIEFDDPNKAQSDAVEFVAAFITKPRIEKTVNKLADEGHYDHPEMPMMEDLPRAVIQDAFCEIGWSDLINGPFEAEWDDDFKGEVRSKSSKKCARLLKKIINQF